MSTNFGDCLLSMSCLTILITLRHILSCTYELVFTPASESSISSTGTCLGSKDYSSVMISVWLPVFVVHGFQFSCLWLHRPGYIRKGTSYGVLCLKRSVDCSLIRLTKRSNPSLTGTVLGLKRVDLLLKTILKMETDQMTCRTKRLLSFPASNWESQCSTVGATKKYEILRIVPRHSKL